MRLGRTRPLAILIALAAALAACDKDEDLSGTYLGVGQFTLAGIRIDIEIRTTVSHAGSSLNGTFTARQLAPIQAPSGSGSVTGTVNGSAVTLNFMPGSSADCPGRFDATSGNNRLTGTMTVTCAVPATAPLELVRQ